MKSHTFTVRTAESIQIVIITDEVQDALAKVAGGDGICTVFTPHTTAALTINENADPDVPSDLVRALRAMIPDVRFDHGEGNSDAHLLSSIIGVSLQIPYRDGRLELGRWQGVYFVELDGPRSRQVTVYA
ncbi:MAG: secondary thiamine-phosphate synthase enzyme YjbQ [Thermoanaerobaculia bacterium]